MQNGLKPENGKTNEKVNKVEFCLLTDYLSYEDLLTGSENKA